MARARWLAREGRTADAESAYREVLAEHPEIKAGWAEYFELLRAGGRAEEALRLADKACLAIGATGFSYTLRGAALIELGRYPEALAQLEQAVEADPDLALVWHELGYAAYKLGDRNRALLALDRAFGLEPHTETLKLRGRILRDAGRYQAAEVAFEGAAQAAEHAEQRAAAEHEIAVTRRYGSYAPRKPDDLSPAERWFADTGAAILAPDPGPVAPGDETLIATFAEVAREAGWVFGQVVVAGPPVPAADELAARLGARLTGMPAFDVHATPLVIAQRPLPGDKTWDRLSRAVSANAAGLVFALEHPSEGNGDRLAGADVVGVLTEGGRRRTRAPNPGQALAAAQHPLARLAGRRLRAPSA